MMDKKTKQIFLLNLSYPFESVHTLLFDSDLIKNIFVDSEYKVKFFLGSDWSIKNSGFSFYGPNKLNSVFELKNIIKNDFIRENTYSITQINEEQINLELECQFSLIKNTCDSTCIMEMRINHQSENDLTILEQYVKISYLKEIVNKIMAKIKILYNQTPNDNKIPKIILNHSFIIKKNYKDSFDFFYNWNNMAKTLKMDKVWKIINEDSYEKDKQEYKNFSIIIKDNIKIYYKVISIKEIKNEKIEIVYEKYGKNYVPALNNFIKFTFFYIDKNLTAFLYETHFPFNISSSIFQTVSYYLFYCNYQSRKYMENL